MCTSPRRFRRRAAGHGSDGLVRRIGAKLTCAGGLLLVAVAFGVYQLMGADRAYVAAMHDAAFVFAGAALLGAIAVGLWLPGRQDGASDAGGAYPEESTGPTTPTRTRRGRPAHARRS